MSKNNFDHRTDSSDVVYFNAKIINREDVAIEANFNQTRAQNILDKTNDYYLNVLRVDMPHDVAQAIFNFTENDYYITINEGGTDKTVQLLYESRGNPTANLSTSFQGIYTVQQFLDILNTAFNTAHLAAPLSPGNPPIMTVEHNTGKFYLNIDTLYTGDIFFNYPLFKLFIGLDATFLSYSDPLFKDYQILYGQVFNNVRSYIAPLVGSYYFMTELGSSQYKWSNVKDIIVSTVSMPCKKEYLGIGNLTTSDETQGIADYVPVTTNTQIIRSSDWAFATAGTPRYVVMESDAPLRVIDFRILLVNKSGFIFPLSIAPGQTISVKFMFVKKSLVNNEYNGLTSMGEKFRNNFLGGEFTDDYGNKQITHKTISSDDILPKSVEVRPNPTIEEIKGSASFIRDRRRR